MKHNYFNIKTLIVVVLLLLPSCEEVGEYYIGYNKQPDFFEGETVEGMNVFGVLRPGIDEQGLPFSFMEVLKLIPALDTSYSLEIKTADITVTPLAQQGDSSQYKFDYEPTNAYKNSKRYANLAFVAKAGQKYKIKCTAPGYDSIGGEVLIPNKPQILQAPLVHNSKLEFTIMQDTTAFMYDVYIYTATDFQLPERLFSEAGANTNVSVNLKSKIANSSSVTYLQLFAYDKNLMRYYSESNTFYKPNSYRPLFTTVDGGYGCWGAVNSEVFVVSGE